MNIADFSHFIDNVFQRQDLIDAPAFTAVGALPFSAESKHQNTNVRSPSTAIPSPANSTDKTHNKEFGRSHVEDNFSLTDIVGARVIRAQTFELCWQRQLKRPMARLNEPPQPTESVDALKRRFVRQNRDLAKSNSTQSLRIRTLEAETSRLLSDNISLRAQLIKLQTEVDTQRTRYVVDEVGTIKEKLEQKVKELGGFVLELGGLQTRVQNHGELQRGSRGGRASPQRSPDQKNWKNAFTLSEVTGGQDGRLPAIVEDKAYPRLTLGHDELARLLSEPGNNNDSPDLGPPPIAHFEEEDPIKFDPGQKQSEPGHVGLDGVHEIPAALSANLETRKKRRDSAAIPDFKRASRFEPRVGQSREPSSAIIQEAPEQPLRVSAKRKLDVRDVEDRSESARSTEGDDFTFQRNVATTTLSIRKQEQENLIPAESRVSTKVNQELADARGVRREKTKHANNVTAALGRKALGPKSVNTDPMTSPVKASRATVVDQIADLKKDAARKAGSKDRSRDKKPLVTAIKVTKVPEQEAEPADVPIDVQEPPPETPAGLDLRSPLTSEPSAARPESRDTPPPPDLTSAGEGVNAAGRPSRRPRGSVSYAEPSLNTKMRRPTKELVDAVTSEGLKQRASYIKHERGRSDSEIPGSAIDKEKLRTVLIKKEIEPDQSWKNLPSAPSSQHQKIRAEAVSPLGTKVGTHPETLPSSIITQRGRRASTLHSKPASNIPEPELSDKPTATSSSASAAAISTLIAGSKKTSRENDRRKDELGLDEALEKLDIYDFQNSSSPTNSNLDTKITRETTQTKEKSSRRQSTLLTPPIAAPSSSEPKPEAEDHHQTDNPPTKETSSSRGSGRRRETLTPSTNTSNPHQIEDADLERDIRNAKNVLGLKGDGGQGSLRAERAASRRRSMML
ncbi:MAG: hypothetical protein M1812_007177 [Candelaria pacifica]|nr:MAG: hypothetical protein M1812_007177 [Candelaria pacifica]